MDRLFRQYQWVLPYLAIVAMAGLLAIIVNDIVASQLAGLTVPKLPTYESSNGPQRPQSDQTSGPQPGQWDDKLSSRCLFGCADQKEAPKKCPDGCEDGEKCQDGVCVPVEPKASKSKSDVPVESDLGVKLVGCMVADNPDYSLAMVQNAGSQQTYIVGPGDYLPKNSKVVRIKRDRIYIKRNGQLEYIRLNETIGGAPSPTSVNTQRLLGRGSSASSASRGSRPAGSSSDDNPAADRATVRSASKKRVVLERDSLKAKLDNPTEIVNDARFVSNFKNGKRQGVKLVGVAPSGLYSKLGFDTGDVLHAIEGETLTSKRQARNLLKQLEDSKNVDVVLERNGSKLTRQFVIE